MVGASLHLQRPALAACLLLGFTAYFRPGELLELTPQSFVPPQPHLDQRLQHWGLIVRPEEYGILAKTGECDESILRTRRARPAMARQAPPDPAQPARRTTRLALRPAAAEPPHQHPVRHAAAGAAQDRGLLAEAWRRVPRRSPTSTQPGRDQGAGALTRGLVDVAVQEGHADASKTAAHPGQHPGVHGRHIELNLEKFFLSGAAPLPPASHAKLLRP